MSIENPDNPGEETPAGNGPDFVPFSDLRKFNVDSRLPATRRLVDAIARIEEDGPSGGNVVYTAIAHLVNAIQDVESQFVILRQQVQGD